MNWTIDNWRHEKKFILNPLHCCNVEHTILGSIDGLESHYPDRLVSSLYFDTDEWDCYQSSVNGESLRRKFRVRWYGSLSESDLATLEIKEKNGHTNRKHRFELPVNGSVLNNFDRFEKLTNELLQKACFSFARLRPRVVCSYERSYFYIRGTSIRITLDSKLTFYRTINNKLISPAPINCPYSVIEYKFYPDESSLIYSQLQNIPVRHTRFSKFVSGIRLLGDPELL